MAIKIGTVNNLAPQAPQSIAGDDTTPATWVTSGQVWNTIGAESLGLNISDLSVLTPVGNDRNTFINIGLQPTLDTAVHQINVGNTSGPNVFSVQKRVYSGGVNNSPR